MFQCKHRQCLVLCRSSQIHQPSNQGIHPERLPLAYQPLAQNPAALAAGPPTSSSLPISSHRPASYSVPPNDSAGYPHSLKRPQISYASPRPATFYPSPATSAIPSQSNYSHLPNSQPRLQLSGQLGTRITQSRPPLSSGSVRPSYPSAATPGTLRPATGSQQAVQNSRAVIGQAPAYLLSQSQGQPATQAANLVQGRSAVRQGTARSVPLHLERARSAPLHHASLMHVLMRGIGRAG